ncbi:iron-siderophore ABC transporter substrate-binding protein [Moritella sp. F3]|uniref:ABC transporter substrate-binding protein n=1 Tax=Moritella sp. F3 TaxID=2718882 RepID=UPI0018E1C850|nr:iron-siderophore ABC transporter substrate-binding protein [Moritella sp. F3]GIC76422.1 iron-hydroxamate ABC transporter substrate-binding protein [Moritella sp. F1]GIC80909.1 iron-hydroxamate ABC transporter substrate-binding protein [Moritella sp. F3]
MKSTMKSTLRRLQVTKELMFVAMTLLPMTALANDINAQVFTALAQPLPLTGLTQTYQQQPKVVALNWSAAEMLLSLGIQPQAVTSRNGYRKWQSNSPALPADVVDVGNRAFPSFPLLMQLQPDLIVGYPFRHARISDDLNRIAPTLLLQQFGRVEQPQYRYMQQMRSNYLTLAKQLGKVELAQTQLDDMDVELARLKQQVIEAGLAGKKVAYGKFVGMGYGLRVFSTQSLAASVVNDLGLNYAWDTHLPGKDFTHLQLEQIQLLEDTALILVKETQSKGERMTLSPLWDQHAFVQNNDIYYVPALWSFGGPVSVIRMARAFTAALLEGSNVS